jgi:tetraacyldisaccharide 4'-kinase
LWNSKSQALVNHLASKVGEVELLQFPDHHSYSLNDLKKIFTASKKKQESNRIIITTEKDAVRLEPFKDYIISQGLTIYCVPVKVEFFEEDKVHFDERILSFFKKGIPNGDAYKNESATS